MTFEPTPLVPVLPCEADRRASVELLDWLVEHLGLEGPGKLKTLQKITCEFTKHAASARLAALEEAAKVAEQCKPGTMPIGKYGAGWDDACDYAATAIRSLSQPVEGSAGAPVGPGAMASDPYDLANMLRGYVDRGTPPDIAAFLLERSEAAVALADEVVRLRAAVAASNKGGRDGE